MTLVEIIREKVTRQAQLRSELNILDQELDQAREYLGEFTPPTPLRATPLPPPVSVPVAAEIEAPQRQRVADPPRQAICKGCGIEFEVKPGRAGAFCNIDCYQNKVRVTRSRNAAPAPATKAAVAQAMETMAAPPLRAKAIVLPERRCLNTRCLKKFKPRDTNQHYCASCEETRPKPTSWHQGATKRTEPVEFEVVASGRDFKSAEGLGSTLAGGEFKSR